MRTMSHNGLGPAKIRGGETCTGFSDSCTLSQRISDFFRANYPSKTWSVVADLLGLSERAAKYRMAGTRPYTIEELRDILWSEDGVEFYEMVMDGCPSTAWKYLAKEIHLSKARRKQAEAHQEVLAVEELHIDPRTRRQLRKFSDADKRLNASFAEKETAVGFSRPDVVRSVPGPVAKAKAALRPYAGRGR